MPFHLSHSVKCMCVFLPACMSAPYACRTGIRCEPALQHGGLAKQMELCALIWKLQQMREASIAMWFWLNKITQRTCVLGLHDLLCHVRPMLTLEILAA